MSVVDSKSKSSKKRKTGPFETSNVGHPKAWTTEQWKVIDQSLPEWHEFSLVLNGDADGRNPELMAWKRKEANRILGLKEFEVLPSQVSAIISSVDNDSNCLLYSKFENLAAARKCIIRKFTNYRNKHQTESALKEGMSDAKLYEAMKKAATSLLDYRTFTKGKSIFAKQNEAMIVARRDKIYKEENEDGLPLIACYQKALKEFWLTADRDHWENLAIDQPEDLHE